MSAFDSLLVDKPLSAVGRFLWWIGPTLARALGRLVFSMRIELHGKLPRPPFVVAANHYSHLDPVIVAAAIGNPIRYLAVDELFGHSPTLDRLLHWCGVIPVSRSRIPLRTIKVALARLDAGEAVGVFPEGTRVANWGDLPAKRGAAWLALRTDVPLIPVAIVGTDRAFGIDNRWHRARIRAVVGRPLDTRGADATDLTFMWTNWVKTQLEPGPSPNRKV